MIFDLVRDFADVLVAMPRGHSCHLMLKLLNDGLLRDAQFTERHPTTLFQSLWNACWWYDCPEARDHYQYSPGDDLDPQSESKAEQGELSRQLENWRRGKNVRFPDFRWARSRRPPIQRIGTSLKQKLSVEAHPLASLAFSDDGTLLVSGTQQGDIKLWQLPNGEILQVWQVGNARLLEVDISPSGAYVFAWGQSFNLQGQLEGWIAVWNSMTGEKQVGVEGWRFDQIPWSAVSRGGEVLAVGMSDGRVGLWKFDGSHPRFVTGQHRTAHLPVKVRKERETFHIEESREPLPDPTKLFEYVPDSPGTDIQGMAFSTDNRHLMTYGSNRLDLLDVRTREVLSSCLLERWDRVVSVSPDGLIVAVALSEGGIAIQTPKKELIIRLDCETSLHDLCHFSADGTFLYCHRHPELTAWNLKTGHKAWRLQFRDDGGLLQITSDGLHIAVLNGETGRLKLWKMESGKVRLQLQTPTTRFVDRFAFSGDGSLLVLQCQQVLHAINLAQNQVNGKVTLPDFEVRLLAVSPAGDLIVTEDEHRTVSVWDVATGKLVRQWVEGTAGNEPFAISSDSRYLATCAYRDAPWIWDLTTGAEVTPIPRRRKTTGFLNPFPEDEDAVIPYLSEDGGQFCVLVGGTELQRWSVLDETPSETVGGQPATSISISRDGKKVATGGRSLRVSDRESGRLCFPPIFVPPDTRTLLYPQVEDHFRKTGFTPDGSQVFAVAHRTVFIWNADSGALIIAFREMQDHVTDVASSPEGSTIASCCQGRVCLRDAQSGVRIREWKLLDDAEANCITWGTGSGVLAVGANTGEIQLFETQTGVFQSRLDSDSRCDSVTAISFAPDMVSLAAGYADGTLRIWDLKSGQPSHEEHWDCGSIRQIVWCQDGASVILAFEFGSPVEWNPDSQSSIEIILSRESEPSVDGEPIAAHSLSVSGNGQWLAIAGSDGVVRIRDLVCQCEVRKERDISRLRFQEFAFPGARRELFKSSDDHHSPLESLAVREFRSGFRLNSRVFDQRFLCISADGNSGLVMSTDGDLCVLNRRSGEMSKPVGDGMWLSACSIFSGDGNRLIGADETHQLRIYDWKQDREYNRLSNHPASINALAESRDGQWIASGCADGSVFIHSIHETASQCRLTSHEHRISQLVLSMRRNLLFTAADEPWIHVWDAVHGRHVAALCGQENAVGKLCLSANEDFLLAGQAFGLARPAIRVWNSRRLEPLQILLAHRHPVSHLAVSADGQEYWSLDVTGRLLILEARSGGRRRSFRIDRMVAGVAFAPMQRLVAWIINEAESVVRIRSLDTGDVDVAVSGLCTEGFSFVCFSSDETRVITIGRLGMVYSIDWKNGVFDSGRGDGRVVVECANISHDRKILIVGSDDECQIIQAESGECSAVISLSEGKTSAVAISADLKYAVVGKADGSVIIQEIRADDSCSDSGTSTFPIVHLAWEIADDEATCLLVSHDSTRLYVGRKSGSLSVYDLTTGKLIHTTWAHACRIATMSLDATGEILLVATGTGDTLNRDSDRLRVWNIDQLKEILSLPVRQSLLQSAVSSWQQHGISANGDWVWCLDGVLPGTLRAWNVHGGRVLFETDNVHHAAHATHQNILVAARSSETGISIAWYEYPEFQQIRTLRLPVAGRMIRDLGFSPDGATLVLALGDASRELNFRKLICWSEPDWIPIETEVHINPVEPLEFSADGRQIRIKGICPDTGAALELLIANSRSATGNSQSDDEQLCSHVASSRNPVETELLSGRGECSWVDVDSGSAVTWYPFTPGQHVSLGSTDRWVLMQGHHLHFVVLENGDKQIP